MQQLIWDIQYYSFLILYPNNIVVMSPGLLRIPMGPVQWEPQIWNHTEVCKVFKHQFLNEPLKVQAHVKAPTVAKLNNEQRVVGT